ncbi:MAG: hypothetical protein ALAOOOJD_04611 [bacterium]|nr:hypothetical protein [bacterium]
MVYWLTQNLAEVPPDDDWLTSNERAYLAKRRFPKRRAEWRLGRWTAKCALAAYSRQAKPDLRAVPFERSNPRDAQIRLHRMEIEIRAATDGAPEAFLNDKPLMMTLSISHRNEIGFCVINPSGFAVGCDVEMIEPRSDHFAADYFVPEERHLVMRASAQDRPWVSTLIWSAKESALKALRQGLRFDTRSVVVDFENTGNAEDWNSLSVRQIEASRTFHGWWRMAGKLIQTMVAELAMARPLALRI